MHGGGMAESILDNIQDKVALVDGDGVVTDVNAAVVETLGMTRGSYVGENAFEHIHPDGVDHVAARFEAVRDGSAEPGRTVTYRHATGDGDWVWLESRIATLDDGTGGTYVVSSRDISARVEAERREAETESLLAELARTSSDVLWTFTGDWAELLFLNEAYESVYGQPVEAVERNPTAFTDAVAPDDRDRVREAMARLSGGSTVEIEFRVDPSNDYGTWVWVRAVPVVEDGEVVRIAGFTRDITDRRRRERHLFVMDTILRHNLRNDLNVVLGRAEQIAQSATDVAEEAGIIDAKSRALLDTANKQRAILDVLGSHHSHHHADLLSTAREACESVADRYPAATVHVTATSAARAADATVLSELGRAVAELVENAIVHSEDPEPSVRVVVDADGDRPAVTVEDETPPIPEVEANVLRGVHEMDDVVHSTGLGLWLVYWTVDVSGGEVTVESTPTAGNSVRIHLPQSPPTDSTPSRAAGAGRR